MGLDVHLYILKGIPGIQVQSPEISGLFCFVIVWGVPMDFVSPKIGERDAFQLVRSTHGWFVHGQKETQALASRKAHMPQGCCFWMNMSFTGWDKLQHSILSKDEMPIHNSSYGGPSHDCLFFCLVSCDLYPANRRQRLKYLC